MMDLTMVALRLIHILGGIFWVGTLVFVAAYLAPSMNDAGPDAGKVMAALGRRGFMKVMPVIAVLTMLSGIWLYWRVSGGFDRGYMRSGPGHAYAIGGGLAVIAFILGVVISRPAMMKAGKLAQSMADASPADREAMMAEMQALRAKGGLWGKIVAWMLGLAAASMAVGRYV